MFVTPEYNYGMPSDAQERPRLPGPRVGVETGFVSYGHTSAGTRAVQHAKQVVTTLRLVPLGATVALRIADALRGERLEPEARHAEAAEGLLEELVRVARALTPVRERSAATVEGPLPGSYARRLTPDDANQVLVLQRCCWTEEALANGTLAIAALHESPPTYRPGWPPGTPRASGATAASSAWSVRAASTATCTSVGSP